jgi:hypothetical protein
MWINSEVSPTLNQKKHRIFKPLQILSNDSEKDKGDVDDDFECRLCWLKILPASVGDEGWNPAAALPGVTFPPAKRHVRGSTIAQTLCNRELQRDVVHLC